MTDHPRRPWLFPLVAALLVLHYALAVASKRDESTTSDEIVHLTGGFTFNHFHDYRLHPENGILPQRIAALPATLAGAKYPSLEQEYWRKSDAWVLGHQFFYETGEDHFPRLMAGRALIACFNVATGLLVFLWSRRLFGDMGALVSVGFFAFEPNLLANGGLATSDACATFFLLASVGAWWRHLHDGRARWWAISAVTFGFACVAKYSSPLLVPMFVALAAVRARTSEPLVLLGRQWTTGGGKFGAAALSALGHGVVAMLVIWAFFGFRYSAANPTLPPLEHFIRPWEWMDANLGAQGKFIRALAAARVLPEGYLYGLAYVLETAQIRSAFLNGEFSTTGWPTFFLWTFALKTTLPLLAAGGTAFVLLLRRGRATAYALAPLIVLFTVYWAFSITSHLNIGHRHILPTYPVLLIALGALGPWLANRGLARHVLMMALLGWHTTDALRLYPHFLAYFNPLAGGPANGHRHLVDSSLDWGQDLPGLKQWLDTHARHEPVFLSYFGTGEPDYYGIRAHRLPFVNGFKIPQPYVRLEAGVYAVSATTLSHVYSTIRGPWTLALEKEYLDLRAREPLFATYTRDPQSRPALEREVSPAQWRKAISRHDHLRFARLCYYLRVRQPDAHIGYSILIYRLTAAEIAAATDGPLSQWSKLIEQAVSAQP